MSIHFRIMNIIAEITQIPCENKIDFETLDLIHGWDSIQALKVMIALEKEFKIDIPLYKYLETKTLSDLIKLIASSDYYV